MSIKIIDNFQLSTTKPIDDRMVVGGENNRYPNKDAIELIYVGLRVWDINESKSFVWDGSDWIEDGGSGESGGISGTVSYIPRFTSSNTISNSVIFQDSDRIGINNTNPTTALDVDGTIKGNTIVGDISANNINAGILPLARLSGGGDHTFLIGSSGAPSWIPINEILTNYGATLDNDVFSDVDAGAIAAGETIAQGTTFTEFVEQLLTKIFYPTFTPYSISGNAGSAVEVGTGTKTVTVNFTRGNIVGDVDSGVWNPTLVQGQVLGAANKYWINGTDNGASNSASVSEITTLGSNSVPIAVDYDEGAQPKDSKGNGYLTPEPSGTLNGTATWTGFYYRTAMAGNDAPTASDIRNNYTARRSSAGLINLPSGTTNVRFDVFVPQGSTLTSAIDEGNLNLDITSEFELQSSDFSGLDANGDEVLYKHYVRIVDNPYTVSSNITITVT